MRASLVGDSDVLPCPLHHRPDLQSDLLGARHRHLEERRPVGIESIAGDRAGLPVDSLYGNHHATRFRPVRTERPSTAARTTRTSSRLPRTPAAPNASNCIDTPIDRASGRQPGPEPGVSRSNADHVAAGTPVSCAAIADRHRREDDAAPAADAITASNGDTGQVQPSIASTAASVRIQAGAARSPSALSEAATATSMNSPTGRTSSRRTAPIRPRVEADPIPVSAAAASAAYARRAANRAWEENAAERLRAGDPTALTDYAEHQRIRSGDQDQMTDQAYTG